MLTTTRSFQIPACLLLAWCSGGFAAEGDWCPVSAEKVGDTPTIRVTADTFTAAADDYARLSGIVQVTHNRSKLRADTVNYDIKKKRFKAEKNVLYTNCDPKDPSWFIAADQVTMSQRQVLAKDVWFVFAGMPLAYFPRYRVLLEPQRRSGFLTPHVGIGSNTGFDTDTPFYFNLAPNRDATLTPRWLTRRGLQINGEHRHLHAAGLTTVKTDWLNDRDYKSDRYSYAFSHNYADNHFNLEMLVQQVSDRDYLDDLGDTSLFSSNKYLPSRLRLDYVWKGWQLNMLAETFQTADDDTDRSRRSHERRPSLSLSKRLPAANNNEIHLYANWTKLAFRGSNAENRKVDGQRFDSFMAWRRPYRRPGFHFTPSAKLRYTGYDLELDNAEQRRLYPQKISRTIPSFSLRSGLVFEKRRAGSRFRRTLEPEIYYLNVGHERQDSIPNYGADLPKFRFSELFSDNRFTGVDRIGDADQLSLALTHRLTHKNSAREALRFSIGQIFYFRNNKVTLDTETGSAAGKRDESDLAAELLVNLNEKLTLLNSFVWDSGHSESSRMNNRLSLNGGGNRLINLFHHYQRDQYEQIGFSFSLPVLERWQLFGGWSRDTKSGRDLHSMLGFGYKSCCWNVLLLGQRTLKDIDGGTLETGTPDYRRTIGIEFNFRGLGSVAGSTDKTLEDLIPGYRRLRP